MKKTEYVLHTLDQISDLADYRCDAAQLRIVALGLTLQLASDTGMWPQCAFAQAVAGLHTSIEREQTVVYFDRAGVIAGFVSWMLLDAHTSDVLLGGKPGVPVQQQRAAELWIQNFAAPFGDLHAILAHLRDSALAQFSQLTYFRVKGKRRMIKRVSRKDRSSFFRAPGRTARSSRESIFERHDLGKHVLAELRRADELAKVALILSREPRYASLPLGTALAMVRLMTATRQYQLVYGAGNVPVALLIWAWIDPHGALSNETAPRVHASAWNEGDRLCLIDCIGDSDVALPALAALFPEEAEILLAPRERGDGLRRWDRSDRDVLAAWRGHPSPLRASTSSTHSLEQD